MTETPPPVPSPSGRSGLPMAAWIGIGVAGLTVLGLIAFGVYVGFGFAEATSAFIEDYETTLDEVTDGFERLHGSGGLELETMDSRPAIAERQAILDELAGHLAIAHADSATGDRFARHLRDAGTMDAMVDDAIEAFLEEPQMQLTKEWLAAELAWAKAGQELLRLAHEHQGSWSVGEAGELEFSAGVPAAVSDRMVGLRAEVERTAGAAAEANERLQQ